MRPIHVNNVDLAFPASVKHLMPDDLDEIRRDKRLDRKWERFAADWFFRGAEASLLRLKAKPGVDKLMALRHAYCILNSFEPKHEDKMAAVAYLLGEWFEPLPDETKKSAQ